MNNKYLSYSQLSVWLECRQRWKYGYVDRIQRRATFPSMLLGRAVHAGIAALLVLGPDCNTKKYIRADADKNGEQYPDDVVEHAANLAYGAYTQFDWDKYYVYEDGKGPVVERELIAPLPRWKGFHGFIDLILKDSEGRLWIVDHKVRRQFLNPSLEEVSLQMAIYQYLAAANDIYVTGTILNEIRPDPKPGSKALPFRQTMYYRSPLEVRNVWNEIVIPAAEEIAIVRDYPQRIYRNMSYKSCNGCMMREICLEDLRGGDTEFLLETAYKYRD